MALVTSVDATSFSTEIRLAELQEINNELKNLKTNSKIYKQQPNTYLFFEAEKSKITAEVDKEIKVLKKRVSSDQ